MEDFRPPWPTSPGPGPKPLDQCFSTFLMPRPTFRRDFDFGPTSQKSVSELMTRRNYCVISEHFVAHRLRSAALDGSISLKFLLETRLQSESFNTWVSGSKVMI